MSEIVKILGNNIRRLRKELGWTQEVLAEKANISVPFMTQIELGRKSASLEVIENISIALGVSFDIMFINSAKSEDCTKHKIKMLEKVIIDQVVNTIQLGFDSL